MKLYVCWGTFPTVRPGGHPCANAYHALRDAGHEPEVTKVRGLGIGPGFLHLMTAGRLKSLRAGEKGPKTPAFALEFHGGSKLVLTENARKKRAGVWLLTPEAAEAELVHLGPDALEVDGERMAEILAADSRRLHPLLRDQRAIETFWTTSPILNGIRSRKASHWGRPHSDAFHFLKPTTMPTIMARPMYHWPVTKCDIITVNLVIVGSSPPKSLKIFSKTGTRNVTSASSTEHAKPPISAGYIIADLTWRRSESSFSS